MTSLTLPPHAEGLGVQERVCMEAASLAFHPGPEVQREQGGKGPALLCLVNLVSLDRPRSRGQGTAGRKFYNGEEAQREEKRWGSWGGAQC